MVVAVAEPLEEVLQEALIPVMEDIDNSSGSEIVMESTW